MRRDHVNKVHRMATFAMGHDRCDCIRSVYGRVKLVIDSRQKIIASICAIRSDELRLVLHLRECWRLSLLVIDDDPEANIFSDISSTPICAEIWRINHLPFVSEWNVRLQRILCEFHFTDDGWMNGSHSRERVLFNRSVELSVVTPLWESKWETMIVRTRPKLTLNY